MFFKFLVREGILDADPSLTIESPKIAPNTPGGLKYRRGDSLLSQPDVKTGRGLRTVPCLNFFTPPVRVSELVNLKLTSIILRWGILSLRKRIQRKDNSPGRHGQILPQRNLAVPRRRAVKLWRVLFCF